MSVPLRRRLDLSATLPATGSRRVLLHATSSLVCLDEVRAHHRGIDAYDQRALLIAGADDLVVTHGAVDRAFTAYLQELGIGSAVPNLVELELDGRTAGLVEELLLDEATLARLARRLPDKGTVLIEPFLAGTSEFELARRLGQLAGCQVELLGDPAVTARVNRKDVQRSMAQELGVPLAPGDVVWLEPGASGLPRSVEPLRLAIMHLLQLGHRALLRGCNGASGSSTRIVVGAPDLAATLDWAANRSEDCYLVDRFHEVNVSPNVLVFVPADSDRAVRFVAATDQILDEGLSHAGNRFPSTAVLLDEMIDHALALGQRLRHEGYAGWVGCDFCEYVDEQAGVPAMFFAELNARINGACYPVGLAARWWEAAGQDAGAFVAGFASSDARSFARLASRLDQQLLGPDRREGVLPYNTACLAHGYCAAMVLDHAPQAAAQRWTRFLRVAGDG